MSARRPASRLALILASLLLGGALLTLVSAWLLPYEGLEDLGRVVGAMLLAAVAAPFFLLGLALGRGTGMPRWMVAVGAVGALVGLVPAIALLSVRL